MALIDEATMNRLRERLAALAGPVELRLYRKPDSGRLVLPSGVGCATCDLAQELLRSVADAGCVPLSSRPLRVSARAGPDGIKSAILFAIDAARAHGGLWLRDLGAVDDPEPRAIGLAAQHLHPDARFVRRVG